MSEDFVPFSERGDDDNIDDFIEMFKNAVTGAESEESESPDGFISDVFSSKGENVGILGNFVLIGETIDEEGKAHLMVVTSDGLPDWTARGLIMVADDCIAQGAHLRGDEGF